MRTRMQLRFRVWGRDLNPDALTQSIGVEPTKSFRVGESQGAAASKLAGWEWHSRWGDWDDDPLLADMLRILQPHESAIRAVADAGATVHLTLQAFVLADLVQSREEAEAKGWSVDDEHTFPAVTSDAPAIGLGPAEFDFLAAVSAVFETHLEFDLDEPFWDDFVDGPVDPD